MPTIVKIGGNVIDNEESLMAFCRDFSELQKRESDLILVHGGGVMASRFQERLGETPQIVEGRRVTDGRTIELVTMTYAGWCNKHIVALLQSFGCMAIGLAGCDADTIRAQKRPPKLLSDGKTLVDYGFVGDVTPESINTLRTEKLLGCGFTPVFCAINHDAKGNLLNTNADTIASSLATAFKAKLFYCFEKNGVLYDRNDEKSVIPHLTPDMVNKFKAEGRISDGMLPKIENAFAAIKAGAKEVIIKNSAQLLQENCGTRLTL